MLSTPSVGSQRQRSCNLGPHSLATSLRLPTQRVPAFSGLWHFELTTKQRGSLVVLLAAQPL